MKRITKGQDQIMNKLFLKIIIEYQNGGLQPRGIGHIAHSNRVEAIDF